MYMFKMILKYINRLALKIINTATKYKVFTFLL